MPDGLTHMVAGYLFLGRRIAGSGPALFLLGCLLPDLLLRGGRLLFFANPDRDFIELFLAPLHTPFTSALLCLCAAFLFAPGYRHKAFLWLWAGCLAHFSLDVFQRTILGIGLTFPAYGGYHWLFPFSRVDFQLGTLWSEHTTYLLILLVPAAVLLMRKKRGQHEK